MQSSEVQIHTGGLDSPYKAVGIIEAKVSAASAFSKTPTHEDVNAELQQKAVQMFCNAVINVEYNRGMSLTSYKVLRAKGTAVIMESNDVDCPMCAEKIKRAARKCKHCGSDVKADA